MKKLILTITALSIGMAVGAQNIVQAIDFENGKAVRRITFDREQVNIVYADGQVLEGVDEAVIVKEILPTAIEDVKANESTPKAAVREVYDLQGRLMSGTHELPQGIYIVREGEKVYKWIKK